MPLLSPQANLFEAILQKLETEVPALRYIEQDFGQLENYEIRPSVAWPCALIDIEELKYSDANNHHNQIAEGIISIRLGMVKYTDANNLTPTLIRAAAHQYYELEHTAYKVLHGWNPAGFGKLLRRASGTERREDDIRVRIIKFSVSFTDDSAKKDKTMASRPGGVLGTINPNS
jgi:hypothetical protein